MSDIPEQLWVLDAAGSDDPEQSFWSCEPPGWNSPDPWPPRERVTPYTRTNLYDEAVRQRDMALRAMRLAIVWLNTQHPTNNAVKHTLAHTKEELRAAIAECERGAT